MDELDEFFANLEKETISSKSSEVPSLDKKIIDDFHGNVPIFNEEVSGQLPTITPKAQIYITEVLEQGQYFRFAVDGGGCSGFNYAFDTETHPKKDAMNMINTWDKVVEDYVTVFNQVANRDNIVRY